MTIEKISGFRLRVDNCEMGVPTCTFFRFLRSESYREVSSINGVEDFTCLSSSRES
jgi:hypothetical protein